MLLDGAVIGLASRPGRRADPLPQRFDTQLICRLLYSRLEPKS